MFIHRGHTSTKTSNATKSSQPSNLMAFAAQMNTVNTTATATATKYYRPCLQQNQEEERQPCSTSSSPIPIPDSWTNEEEEDRTSKLMQSLENISGKRTETFDYLLNNNNRKNKKNTKNNYNYNDANETSQERKSSFSLKQLTNENNTKYFDAKQERKSSQFGDVFNFELENNNNNYNHYNNNNNNNNNIETDDGDNEEMFGVYNTTRPTFFQASNNMKFKQQQQQQEQQQQEPEQEQQEQREKEQQKQKQQEQQQHGNVCSSFLYEFPLKVEEIGNKQELVARQSRNGSSGGGGYLFVVHKSHTFPCYYSRNEKHDILQDNRIFARNNITNNATDNIFQEEKICNNKNEERHSILELSTVLCEGFSFETGNLGREYYGS